MRLNGQITELQYDVGMRLRAVTRRWYAVVGVPRPDRGAMPLDGARNGTGGVITDAWAERARRDYRAAWCVLRDCCCFADASHIVALCAYDEPAIAALNVYRLALDDLAKHWGYRFRKECE